MLQDVRVLNGFIYEDVYLFITRIFKGYNCNVFNIDFCQYINLFVNLWGSLVIEII